MKTNTEETAIKITSLVKEYKMFARKKDRLLEAIFPNMNKHGIFKAMDNLNLEVKKGEVLGILGKNGAGKSTLLKMITGVVTPTSGTIEVNGKISSLLELGTAFNMELTGIENIYQHGQVMGLTNEQIKEKEKEIIEFADIGEHINQPVKTYSSGMFARLAFSCAINVEPDILIVDEVLSVGDMAFQLKCFKKFEQFKNAGKTILFVTHSVADVLKNCTRAIIIESGKKTFDGSTKDAVEKYKKIIVGADLNNEDEKNTIDFEKNDFDVLDGKESSKAYLNNLWKEQSNQNPDLIEYGNKHAEVIDYGVFDSNNNIITAFDNSDLVTFRSKIKFNQEVKDPIFTLTVKDFHGNDMAGTNTEIEKVITGNFKSGDVAICEFKTRIPLKADKYTLSFSCTRYNLKGELEVLNRKYDALLVEIFTSKQVVGMIKLDTDINVIRL